MKTIFRILFVIILLAIVINAHGQNFDARMNALLAEVDASDIEYNIAQIANVTATTLANFQITNTAIIPFRDENNRRTGLTEFIAAEFGKKLQLKQTVAVIAADQVASVLRNQINLVNVRWTQDCPDLAVRLEVSSLIRGRISSSTTEINLTIDIYSDERNSVIDTHRTNFPRTAGLARLSDLIIDETPALRTEISPPLPQLPPTVPEKPKYEPVPAPTFTPTIVATALEVAIRNLADKLAAGIGEAKQVKIGVLEFLDLQGRISQLGKFIAEDLTTALFEQRKFSMVERGLLQQVMREHALTQTGILELTLAQEIGKMVGADAIITGSLSDIGNEIKANARLIDVGNGTVLAVAGESIAKTDNVSKMFNTILWAPGTKILPSPQPVTTTSHPAPSGDVYFEDFQNVQEGMLPDGWIDGEKLMVKSDGRQKFVTTFERANTHRFTIDNVQFPEDFELEYMFRFGEDAYGTHQICSIGDVKITIDVYGSYQMNDTKFEKKQDYRNRTVKVLLRKSGPLFKLFINGEEMIMGRYPAFQASQCMTFEFQNMNGFKLIQVGLKNI